MLESFDPDGDPIEIMAAVRRRFEMRQAADRRYEKEKRAAEEKRDLMP